MRTLQYAVQCRLGALGKKKLLRSSNHSTSHSNEGSHGAVGRHPTGTDDAMAAHRKWGEINNQIYKTC